MSTENIIDISPVEGKIASAIGAVALSEIGGEAVPAAIRVTFKVRGGVSVYEYDDPVAVQDISAGGDPAKYLGTKIS
jgi:hypothetical protein